MLRRGIRLITSRFKSKTAVEPFSAHGQFLVQQGYFDSAWYLANYPDVAASPKWQKRPVQHYIELGVALGYNPSVWFNTAWYLKFNSDVKQAAINPLLHYVQHGVVEGRKRAEHLLLSQSAPEYQFLRLSEQGITFTLPIFKQARSFKMSLLFQQYEKTVLAKPCGILLIRCLDNTGQSIKEGVTGLTWSESFNCWYRYLAQKDTEKLDADIFKIGFPEQVTRCEICIRPWQGRAFEVRNRFSLQLDALAIPKTKVLTPSVAQPKMAADLKVAVILDEFSHNSFKDEFKAIVIEPDTWREQFATEQPDIFFCESAWSGADSKRRPWKGKIYASENFAKENRTILLEILRYCADKGIPTVFWNKEDPTHYVDRKHDFVKTATLFDYVFTSAEECVDRYKQDYKLKNVFALPFATNPRLFNPLQTSERSNKVVFAGSWYANHEERSKVMEQILDSLIACGFEPEIYDRYYGDTDPLHIWPEKYLPYIKPSQPHDQMPAVYKSSAIGLNFNTVTESSTMFARRVFELMSSNTLVVSNYAKGVAEMFGDLVIFADNEPERLRQLSTSDFSFIREQALNLVLKEHTYAKRWRYILNCIGLKVHPDNEAVTLVSRIATDAEAMASISYFEQNFGRNSDCRLLLVVTKAVPDIDVAGFYQKYNRFGITVTSESFMQKHALEDKYQPVVTPYFMLFSGENPPLASWLDKAKLHLSYQVLYPITPYQDQPYELTTVADHSALVGHAKSFLVLHKAIRESKPTLAYGV